MGVKIHAVWSKAYSDLPALVQSLQPKIGELTNAALSFVAGIGLGILQFIASRIIAGILMAFGHSGAQGCLAIFSTIAGNERGAAFTKLSTQTIRAVAQGVLGVALIQAIIIGFCLIIAGVPWAGALSAIVLVLGIAQLPALLVTLPAIAYIWSSGDYGNVEAILFSVLLFIAGMADNILKPLLLGRGVDAPMPVITDRRTGWHGSQGHPRHVCRRHTAGDRLPDFHGLGACQPGCRYRQCAERHFHCRLGRVLDDPSFSYSQAYCRITARPGKCPAGETK